MDKNVLYMIPSGGLANRMRAIVSGYWLAKEIGSRLQIIWFQDWALNAPFHEIFEPLDSEKIPLREATFTDHLLYDRARKKNLWLPALPQKILFDRIMHEEEVKPLKLKGFDFTEWARGHRCYMSNFMHFGNWPTSLYNEIFKPVKPVTDTVSTLTQQFSKHTIGVHIRRGDNNYCIEKSPTQLYIDKIKHEIDCHEDTKVFLATDSNDVKKELRQIFGNRIITVEEQASRDSVEGIRGGLADLYSLSATTKIYGSIGSTYAIMAADIGGIEMHDLQV